MATFKVITEGAVESCNNASTEDDQPQLRPGISQKTKLTCFPNGVCLP
jgi:hypothetical protein